MGDPEAGESNGPSPRLLVWCLSSFHAALLVVLVVGALYDAGVLGDLLAGLQTWLGTLAYLYLWAVTLWTNRRVVDGLRTDLTVDRPRPGALLAGAAKWGAVAGLLVFLPVLLAEFALFASVGSLRALPFLVLLAAIGAILAVLAGAVVGGLFAMLDLALLRGGRAWLPEAGSTSGATDH